MAVPASIDDLSATAASNGPDGGVDLPSAYDDYIRALSAFIRQIRDGDEQPALLSSVSGTDTITASAPASVTAYATGARFAFVSAGANTTAVTLNINSIGAVAVTKRGSTALAADDIASGALVVVQYDGTRFQVVSPLGDDAVKLTGNQTVAGIKTFSSSPIVPTPTTDFQAATKGYADTVATAVAAAAVSPATLAPTLLVAGTSVSGSGSAAYDFTGIPSWARRVTVPFQSISVNGASSIMVQLGDSGGIDPTGYAGSSSLIAAASVASTAFTTGFGLRTSADADVISGALTLTRVSGNVWVASGAFGFENAAGTGVTGGSKTLSGALTQVRITTVGGTAAFDSGSMNVLYE